MAAGGDGDFESQSAQPPTNPLNALISAATSEGLRIDPTHHWLSPLTVSTPMLIEAIDLLVTALSPSSSLQLDVTRDRGGRRDGELLASAELELLSLVPRIPSRFPLGTRLQLQPGGYWLRLQSRDGAAVWHLQALPGTRALQADSNRAIGGGIAGRMGIARWIAATGSATAAPPIPEIRLSGQTISAVRGDNGWLYDLTPAHRIRSLIGTSFGMRHNCASFVDVCSLGANHVVDPLLGLRRYRYWLESAAADLGQVSSGQGRHGNQGGVEQGQRLMPLRGGVLPDFGRIASEIGRETGPAFRVPR